MLWNYSHIQQEFTSERTSINSTLLPETLKYVTLKKGERWADIGGGRFNNVIDYFHNKGATLYVYDPFNRSHDFNKNTVEHIQNGQCDGVMINNVLNVIKEADNRQKVLSQAFNALKDTGTLFIKIYEGNKSGVASEATNHSSSMQNNRLTTSYVPEIEAIFGDCISVKNDVITVIKNPNYQQQIDAAIRKSKSIHVPQRHGKIGKFIGGCRYLHIDYIHELPQAKIYLEKIKKHVPAFVPTIIKFDTKSGSYTFIHSPNFDTADEPIVGDAYRIDSLDNIKYMRPKKDPQIYHHKWNFVANDYTGFDVLHSIQRSIAWKEVMGIDKEKSSKIGTQSYWIEWCDHNLYNNKSMSSTTGNSP